MRSRFWHFLVLVFLLAGCRAYWAGPPAGRETAPVVARMPSPIPRPSHTEGDGRFRMAHRDAQADPDAAGYDSLTDQDAEADPRAGDTAPYPAPPPAHALCPGRGAPRRLLHHRLCRAAIGAARGTMAGATCATLDAAL